MCLNAGAMGRRDAETETLIPITGAVFDVAHADQIAPPITGGPYGDHQSRHGLLVAHSLRADGFDASEDGTGRGTPLVPVHMPPAIAGTLKACAGKSGLPNGAEEADRLVPVAYRTLPNCGAWETGDRIDALTTGTDPNSHVIAFTSKDYGGDAATDLSPTLRSMGHTDSHMNGGGQVAIAIQAGALRENPASGPDGVGVQEGLSYTLEARSEVQAVAQALAEQWAVRRLTPAECEALQGFPRDWTLVPHRSKPAADGPRYKAIGNSMAVNVMRWIGERIAAVDGAA